MFSRIILLTLLIIQNSHAGFSDAERLYQGTTQSFDSYKKIIKELVDDKYFFSTVPWIKNHLVRSSGMIDRDFDYLIDEISSATGNKIFTSLPDSVIKKSSSSSFRFILATRYLGQEKHLEALAELNRIPSSDPSYPIILNFKSIIKSIIGEYADSAADLKECLAISDDKIIEANYSILKEQLKLNRDQCLAGLARINFAQKKFKEAELFYLDISKDSHIWPYILFEEAWNSYYQKNYNRTLGKLVSYKAPILDFFYMPEVETLKALSFFKLCLFDDVKKVTDEFDQKNSTLSKRLSEFLKQSSKNNIIFYQILADFESGRPMPINHLDEMMRSISKDPAIVNLKNALGGAISEYRSIRSKNSSKLRTTLLNNLQTLVEEYRGVIGALVRANLKSKLVQLKSAFKGMSYIKLEVLALKKEKLYQNDNQTIQKRGDVKFLERNEKQYFWNFNGEFWADELGDYVFALGSEC